MIVRDVYEGYINDTIELHVKRMRLWLGLVCLALVAGDTLDVSMTVATNSVVGAWPAYRNYDQR